PVLSEVLGAAASRAATTPSAKKTTPSAKKTEGKQRDPQPRRWLRRLKLEIDALNQRPHRYRNGGPLCHAISPETHEGRPIRTPVSNPTPSASCISPNILCRFASARKTSINTGISRQTSAL